MATGNFYPHENGIFVLRLNDYKEALNYLKEEYNEEDITEDMVYSEMNFTNEILTNEFLEYQLVPQLEEKGYDVDYRDDYTVTVWKNYRIVAELSLEGGYYEGVQLIVETDKDELIEKYVGFRDTVAEELENYTPHNKRLFKIIRENTDEYAISARFCNGETWYSKVS